MSTKYRISEINYELSLLRMKDHINNKDRKLIDELERELIKLEPESSVTTEPEIIIEEKREMDVMDNTNIGNTGMSIIENVNMDAFSQTMNKIIQFQTMMKSQLTDGHDYGIIPGTTKPTLLKPGAEKILMLLGLTSEFDILDSTRDFEKGFFQYQVKCRLYKNGVLITEGLGACNSKEKKYTYTDACNVDNTILKMAKKRALVDATLLVASLSQIFTQDIEDMDLNNNNRKGEEPSKETTRPSQPVPLKDNLANGVSCGLNIRDVITITEAQSKRMFAISKGNKELCREVCARYGYKNSREIRTADYDNMCKEIAQAVTQSA